MELKRLREELEKFGKYVVQQSRSTLTKNLGKNQKGTTSSKGQLYRSIQYFIDDDPAGLRLSFEMEDYGMYQDKGVSGTKKKYDTPFSYKSKQPPTKVIADWAFKKRLLRDKKGKFKKGSYQALGFIIAKSIKEKGLKPSLFFTRPFEAAFKRFPDDLSSGLGEDIFELL